MIFLGVTETLSCARVNLPKNKTNPKSIQKSECLTYCAKNRLLLCSVLHCLESIKLVYVKFILNGQDNTTTQLCNWLQENAKESPDWAKFTKHRFYQSWQHSFEYSNFHYQVSQKTRCFKRVFAWSSDSKVTTSMEHKILPYF